MFGSHRSLLGKTHWSICCFLSEMGSCLSRSISLFFPRQCYTYLSVISEYFPVSATLIYQLSRSISLSVLHLSISYLGVFPPSVLHLSISYLGVFPLQCYTYLSVISEYSPDSATLIYQLSSEYFPGSATLIYQLSRSFLSMFWRPLGVSETLFSVSVMFK